MERFNLVRKLKVSEVQIIYRTHVNPEERVSIHSSKEAYQLLYDLWNKDTMEHHEEAMLVLLNRANSVLGIAELSKGSLNGTLIDTRIVCQYAIKSSATGIILAHNHPSGNLQPSEADKRITAKVKKSLEIMDINLVDHLIVTLSDGYFSFADYGIL